MNDEIRCPKCGLLVHGGLRTCILCGSLLHPVSIRREALWGFVMMEYLGLVAIALRGALR
jgi:hypothetical protein